MVTGYDTTGFSVLYAISIIRSGPRRLRSTDSSCVYGPIEIQKLRLGHYLFLKLPMGLVRGSSGERPREGGGVRRRLGSESTAVWECSLDHGFSPNVLPSASAGAESLSISAVPREADTLSRLRWVTIVQETNRPSANCCIPCGSKSHPSCSSTLSSPQLLDD